MFFRVILATILGGAVVFCGGAYQHMFLDWVGRTIKKPAAMETVKQDIKTHFPEPGVYMTMKSDKKMQDMTPEEQKAMNEEFKVGPSAVVVVAPTGEDMMGNKQLIMQGIADAIAALCVAIVLSMTRPSVGFFGRWFVAILMGVMAWATVNGPYHVWYRFPENFTLDELMCNASKWAAGGFIMAMIVRPKERMAGY